MPRYMSSTLLRVAREHTSVVAVVGKGHLPGIKKNWKQPVEVSDSGIPYLLEIYVFEIILIISVRIRKRKRWSLCLYILANFNYQL